MRPTYTLLREYTFTKRQPKNNMKILFIIPPYLKETPVDTQEKSRSFLIYPYGVLSLGTYLKKYSNTVIKIIDLNMEVDLKKELKAFKPDMVGISIMFDNSYSHISGIAETIKAFNNDTLVLVGGAAATASYKEIIEEQKNVDAVCLSEGEIPLLELVRANNKKEFLNNHCSWVTKNSTNKKVQYTKLNNLDDVVNLDYSMIDVSKYEARESFSPFKCSADKKSQFFIITSRGCPFKCSFCMRSADSDRSMRYASIAKIIEHVRFLIKEYGMNVLTIYDDQLLFNKDRAKLLFKELAQFKIRVECPNGLSLAYIDDEMAQLMKNAGMDTLYLAIESGSPYVLNKLIHKPLNVKIIKSTIDILKKYNFWLQGYFVVGFPGETDGHRQETLDIINSTNLDWSGFSLAFPSKGSLLHKICIENNYIDKNIHFSQNNTNKFIINTLDYSAEYITKTAYLMNLNVNFVNNNRMKIGEYETAINCFAEVLKRYRNHAFAHYYIGKCLKALGREYKECMLKVKRIIKKDAVWLEYFALFNIDILKEIHE